MPDATRGRTDRASIEIAASPDDIYAAFADPDVLVRWLPPRSMTARVREYDFREGGRYVIELSYDASEPASGKTTSHTDVSAGRFVTLEPGARIVQAGAFESDDDAFAGEMILTWTFTPTATGTTVTVTADNVPPGISAEDHAAGLRSTLENLARLLGR